MKRKRDASKKDELTGTLVITGLLTMADAERIQKAFAEGELKHLGVTNVQIIPTSETEPAHGHWTKKARRAKAEPKSQELE